VAPPRRVPFVMVGRLRETAGYRDQPQCAAHQGSGEAAPPRVRGPPRRSQRHATVEPLVGVTTKFLGEPSPGHGGTARAVTARWRGPHGAACVNHPGLPRAVPGNPRRSRRGGCQLGWPGRDPAADRRLAGYRQGMRAAGLLELVEVQDYGQVAVEQAHRLLAAPEGSRPTAVVVSCAREQPGRGRHVRAGRRGGAAPGLRRPLGGSAIADEPPELGGIRMIADG
jgi:hypothetical protein